jgi:hypothetical protein
MQSKGPTMKIKILLSATVLLTGSLLAAQASPADDVASAAQKLGGEPGYSWHVTVVVPEGSRFRPGPQDGKTGGGVTYIKMSFRNDETQVYMKGTNVVVTDPDGGWETLADMASDDQGPGRFIVGTIRNFKTPAAQAADLVAGAKELQQTNGAYAGDLTADAAKKLLSFRGRGGNANISNPSGTVQFWAANGELTKYKFHVKGTVTFNGNDVDIDRDTTVEIKDAGATTIDVPGDVKKLMP